MISEPRTWSYFSVNIVTSHKQEFKVFVTYFLTFMREHLVVIQCATTLFLIIFDLSTFFLTSKHFFANFLSDIKSGSLLIVVLKDFAKTCNVCRL